MYSSQCSLAISLPLSLRFPLTTSLFPFSFVNSLSPSQLRFLPQFPYINLTHSHSPFLTHSLPIIIQSAQVSTTLPHSSPTDSLPHSLPFSHLPHSLASPTPIFTVLSSSHSPHSLSSLPISLSFSHSLTPSLPRRSGPAGAHLILWYSDRLIFQFYLKICSCFHTAVSVPFIIIISPGVCFVLPSLLPTV